MRIRIHFILLSALFLTGICSISPVSGQAREGAATADRPAAPAWNVVVNYSFEQGGHGWNLWGGDVSPDAAHTGKAGLTVSNFEHKWSGADQSVVLPEGAANITVAGWMKTQSVVRGKEDWEKARISIEFRDDLGQIVGGYPPATGMADGTTGWTYYTRDYRVPSSAKMVVVQCALGNAVGTAYFDDIVIIIRNRGGESLKSARLSGIMDEGKWYVMKPGTSGGHYVDWSGLLDAPAGKHGFLSARVDGNLYFENGTPARFWGTNLVGGDCFAPDSVIDSVVTRLAKMGVNMLRLHHMDAPWATPNIFGNTPGTRKFSEKSMRQLDYLISRCKEKGIYIFLDLLVHRDFTEEDGIENRPPDLGGKQVAFFSKDIIALQKEYNENLLNHVNQFTGIAYKDEPAIAMSALINESTIFSAFTGDILTPHYREELEEMWLAAQPEEWGETQFGVRHLAIFGLDWQNDRPRLKLASSVGDVKGSIKFLADLEANYFRDMRDHLRSVGVRYPLAGSNMPLPLLAMLKNNAELDFISSNDYWDHPQVWKIGNDWDRILEAPFNNYSQFKNPKASAIQNKSYYRAAGRPFVMTEWNHCYPNEYALEGVPLVAAYGALQGWNGVLQFDFNTHTLGADRILNYKLSVQPEHAAQWVMAAPLFLRGDVKAAPGIVIEEITEEQYGSLPNYSDMLEKNYHLPFITRVAKTFSQPESSGRTQYFDSATGQIRVVGEDAKPQGNDAGDYAQYFDQSNNIIRSETGELMMDGKTGYMRIDAPRVQGSSGFISGTRFDFPAFSYEISNRHASIFAVSADGADLQTSKRYYLIAAGPARMRGQVYNPSRTQLENAGSGDVMLQVIDGKITFKKNAHKKIEIFPLDADGTRGKKIALKKSKGTLGVFDLSRGRTQVYEVVVVK